MPDSGVASRFISGSSRQRLDSAFSLARALLSNMMRGFETTSNFVFQAMPMIYEQADRGHAVNSV